MARGRRPDNSLEPSRQLLTQRAFRQRRAAHLAELEAKVRKLERENASLKGVAYVEEVEDTKRDKGQVMKKPKSDDERRSTSGEFSASLMTAGGSGETEEDEDDSELVCEGCVTYEKERNDTLNAVANVDECLLALTSSIKALREEVKKHAGKSSMKAEPTSPLSPINSAHSAYSTLPYQYHSSNASPVDNSQLHQYFLEVPTMPALPQSAVESGSLPTSRSTEKARVSSTPYHPYASPFTSSIGKNSTTGKIRSHTRFSQSLDEGQSNNNNCSSSSSGQAFTGPPTYHRSAASVSATCGMAGPSEQFDQQQLSPSPSSSSQQQRGSKCCPPKADTSHEVPERAKKSMMPQARDGRHLQMSGGARRLLEQQQQQQQQYALPEQALMPQQQQLLQQQQPTQMTPQSYYDRFKAAPTATSPLDVEMTGHQGVEMGLGRQPPQGQHQMQAQRSAPLPPVEMDESKCCLGYFECDSEGNLLLEPNAST